MASKFVGVRVLLVCFFAFAFLESRCVPMFPSQQVIVGPRVSKYCDEIAHMLMSLEVDYKVVDSLENAALDDEHLYIIFDLFNIDAKLLPKYYVAYQSLDLAQSSLTQEYCDKLSHAIAIWDFKRDNIRRYPAELSHYYYVPANYEYADPVGLPCFLPVKILPIYKEVLRQSNEKNSDISSHLPALFCYCYLNNPEYIVEAGVDEGKSTYVFRKILELLPSHLFGIDIFAWCGVSYAGVKDAMFLHMDDKKFYDYYMNSDYKDNKIAFIFIDTWHEYLNTMQEITMFTKLLPHKGILCFHDSNVTPENNGTEYTRINGTRGRAVGNTRGVTQAIKEYFSIEFDEYRYVNLVFQKDGSTWHMVHYPFCNGITMIQLVENSDK